MIEDVLEFHNKFGVPFTGEKNMVFTDSEVRKFRINFLQEELDEFVESVNNQDRVSAFDALLDLVYVAHGTALAMGVSPDQWNLGVTAVHNCNMHKRHAKTSKDSKRNTTFDVVKPDGWVGPEKALKTILDNNWTDEKFQEIFGELEDASEPVMVEDVVTPSDQPVVSMTPGTDTVTLLKLIESRGGHPGALASAALLCIKKSEDYNHGKTQNPHKVDRSMYFPFGSLSYAQMLYTKALRFNSVANKINQQNDTGEANFESLEDTAMDIINYAGFYIDAYQKGDI